MGLRFLPPPAPFRRAIARARKCRAEPKGQKSETKRHDTDTIALHSIFLTHSARCYARPKAKKRQTAPD